ncbi:MAG: flagellar export chaperone FliS [Candidatus Zixiibacteriota bacterium]
MIERGIGSYRKLDTLGKSPLELLLMVYGGAAQALKEAEEAFSADDRETGRRQLERARKFITHLYTTLDNEKGGEVAENLGKLYVFIIEQLQVAQATGKTAIISDLREIIENMRAGWTGIRGDLGTPGDDSPAAKKSKSSLSFVNPAQSQKDSGEDGVA